MHPSKCKDVSPQCPEGQEDGYKLGWYQGQIAACDNFHGTPCEKIRHRQEVDALLSALNPFAMSMRIANDAFDGPADTGHLVAVALNYINIEHLRNALRAISAIDTPSIGSKHKGENE